MDVSVTDSFLLSGQAQSIDQISGKWHAFPSGLLIQINEDGSAQFGQDLDGMPIGYRAEMKFRNQQLHVRFTDYFGSEEPCKTAVGRYTVRNHESGAIRFDLVQDECLFRLQMLSGEPDVGMLYHGVSRD